MKKADVTTSTQQSFVVTAVFVTYRTVQAKSVTEALLMAEESLVLEGATSKDLCNWHAHKV